MIVMLACLLTFLTRSPGEKRILHVVNVILIILTIMTFGYSMIFVEDMMERAGIDNTVPDLVCASLGFIIVLECTRRLVGWALPMIGAFFFTYAFWGTWVPGQLGHGGYPYARVIIAVFGYDGILGLATAIAGTFVAMFMVFGAILDATGAGAFFMDLAKAMAGRQRGGPAKIATVASAFFGTISGSAVANVATTGTFTIPLMMRTGYSSTFAAAVEATASTGGMIMPPVMAAGAFVMAEILGVAYLQIMKAALIPALLYFFTVWIAIDLRAARLGLKGISTKDTPPLRATLTQDGHLLVPLFVLIYLLVIVKASPIKAAFWAMASAYIVSHVRKKTMLGFSQLIKALDKGGRMIISVAVPCACAGVVIGAVGLTGLGMNIANVIIALSGNKMILVMILSMAVALIFGMGLPATVSYLLCVAVLAPALITMGIWPIAAHLFIFYFAILSGITPPICMAAYTGAGISGSKPMETGFAAVKLAIAAFILPYIFCYQPVLLMHGGSGEIIRAIAFGTLGVFSLAASVEGWLIGPSNWVVRLLLGVSAVLLLYPGWGPDLVGLGLLSALVIYQAIQKRILKSRIS